MIRDCYKLTQPQISIWHTENIFPGTSFGNIAISLLFKGELDFGNMEKAINISVERNDSFRIRILQESGTTKQYVSKYEYFKIECMDFSNSDGEEGFKKWCKIKTEEPFNLIDSNLYYFAVFKTSSDDYGMYMKVHHIISDGWSTVNQANKIVECYSKLKNGIESSNENEPSYIDYIKSEEEYLESDKFEKDRLYWNDKFITIPEFMNYKTRGAVTRNLAAARKTIRLSKELTSNINNFCEENKCSPYIVFLSLLYIYINRITAKSDIVLGTPVLNRSNIKEKNTVGMFISVVPVRFAVDENEDFITFVKTLSKEWMTLLRHQKFPYSILQKEFRERHKINDSLIDVVLSYQNFKVNPSEITGEYKLDQSFCGSQTESLVFSISDKNNSGEYLIDLDYMVDLFGSEEIESILASYVCLLTDAVSNPGKKLYLLDILPDTQMTEHYLKAKRLIDLKDEPDTIHSIFKMRASEVPDNIAVSIDNKKITYSLLDKKTDSLARLLRNSGVKPDSIVALAAEPSIEMIIGLIGILKAGGAYLPIDPKYPEDRIRFMLEDSKATLLLTTGNIIDFTGKIIDIRNSILINTDTSEPENINKSNDLACIIYTSGSAGKPKGVMVEHRNLLNYAKWKISNFSIGPEDRILQLISFSFDGFGANLYPAILSGAELVLADNRQRTDFAQIPKLIREKEISLMSVVPSMYREILNNSSDGELDSLRYVVLGGEESDDTLLNSSTMLYSGIKLVNEYGPTENTIASTCYIGLTPKEKRNIGAPVENTIAFVVDKHNNLLPFFSAGELCVAGKSLTRGYLHQPRVTDERFIPCPFAPELLMYKTGDFARLHPDGNFEFIGRMDKQVKIRGFRIEIGEIEESLLKHHEIKEAVVIAREGENKNRYLCAYYTSEQKHLAGSELREYLFKILPDYMVPSFFIKMDKMPLSINGKIDRELLPAPDLKIKSSSNRSLPVNEVESKLLEEWHKVLENDSLDVSDNIFEFGIDSLSILHVLANVMKFGWNLTLQDFYEYQSVRKLAEKIIGGCTADFEQEAAAAACNYKIAPNCKSFNGLEKREPMNILLTGVTGFLGIHLLGSLLENTQARIYCLIRSKFFGSNKIIVGNKVSVIDSPENAVEKRLLNHLDFYYNGKYKDLLNERIFVLNGDITYTNLGLNKEEYDSLTRSVDTVLHAAAIVKHFGEYQIFENVNIRGTRNIVEFCINSGAALNYISTISISGDCFYQKGRELLFTENDLDIGQNLDENVYLKSKLEAEKIIAESAGKGLNAKVFRVGNLTGRYSDGLFQSNISESRFYNLLKFIFIYRLLTPDVYEWQVDLTPVEICADAIVGLAGINTYGLSVYHLFNDRKIKISEIIEACGDINVTLTDKESLRVKIEQLLSDSFMGDMLLGGVSMLSLNASQNTRPTVKVSSEITKDTLEYLGTHWPEYSKEYIKKLIGHMKQINFIS